MTHALYQRIAVLATWDIRPKNSSFLRTDVPRSQHRLGEYESRYRPMGL